MALTDTQLKNFKPTGKRYEKADRDGLGIRVSASGVITFQATPTLNGERMRIKYGNYPALSLKDARVQHQNTLELLTKGIDPRVYWASVAQESKTAITVMNLCQEWYERYALQNRKQPEEALRVLKANVYPAIGKLKAKDLTRRDVIGVANNIMDRGSKAMAKRVLALVKQILSYGTQAGILDSNPIADLKPLTITGPQKQRDRVLSDDEIRVIWKTLPTLGLSPSIALCLKLLLVTAQRRGELARARWSDMDLSSDNPVWTIPADNTKNGKSHQVPLSPLALSLLTQLREFGEKLGNNEWVLTGKNPNISLSEKSITRAVSRKQSKFIFNGAQIPHWVPHDLRRTAATKMAELSTPPHIVEKILNHSFEGVMVIYNRYDYLPERREALAIWSERLELFVADHNIISILKSPAAL